MDEHMKAMRGGMFMQMMMDREGAKTPAAK